LIGSSHQGRDGTLRRCLRAPELVRLSWGIEVYHRTTKSGCRIEDRRLDDTDSLETYLAIDPVVAWRTYRLTMVGRERIDIPCDQMLREEDWQMLNT
jgi:hypothetical protein